MRRRITAELDGRKLDDVLLETGKVIAAHFPLPPYQTAEDLIAILRGARTASILAIPPVHIRIDGRLFGSYAISAYRDETVTFAVDSKHEEMERLYSHVVVYYAAIGMPLHEWPPEPSGKAG